MPEADLSTWAALLVGVGIALLVAEVLLPSHGILGVMGVAAVVAAIVCCYMISVPLGTLVLVATACATPFAWIAFVKIWPRTPFGRRVVLPRITSTIERPPILVGQRGVTVSELRPMGLCEFDLASGRAERLEAISEHGMIEPGRTIAVVSVSNNRPVVREYTS